MDRVRLTGARPRHGKPAVWEDMEDVVTHGGWSAFVFLNPRARTPPR